MNTQESKDNAETAKMRGKIAFLFALLFVSESHSETLQPLEIFKRCYIRMVRSVPVETDTLFKQVQAGTKDPVAACAELFDRAQFTNAGVLKNRTSTEAKSILRTFHDLHRSWFQSKNSAGRTADYIVFDIEEAPLYYTRASFLPKEKFSSVVTLKTGLQGVRDQTSATTETNPFLAQKLVRYSGGYPYSKETDLILAYNEVTFNGKSFARKGVSSVRVPALQIVPVGELTGVRAPASIIFPNFRSTGATGDVMESVLKTWTQFKANDHFGGGIIGSQSFLRSNANLTASRLPDKYLHINRRLTARVFEDLLCHQLPTLTDADVATEVDEKSEHMFQRTSSCMRCHSTIDGLGYGFRNLFQYVSASNPNEVSQTAGLNLQGFTALTPSPKATTFAAQVPKGRLHYRELVTGKRHDFDFFSLSELGELIATSPDLYTCAAKRYYLFLTGVDVDLTQAATEPLDKVHQEQVLALGKDFKTHQSVRQLLVSIFASPAFQTRNYMTEEAP